jgi:hypothetical protein
MKHKKRVGPSQKGTSYNQEVINLSMGFEKLTLCLRLPIEADVFENLVVSEANVVLHVQWRCGDRAGSSIHIRFN